MRGVTGEALPLLVQHGWRLEAVLEQAMIFRRGEWITPEDLDLPAPRRNDAGESDGGVRRDGTLEDRVALSWLQHEALRLVAERRELRW